MASNLNECKLNKTNLEIMNTNQRIYITSLSQQNSQCNQNLNSYKNKYKELLNENTSLKSQVKNLTTLNSQYINNYDSCRNQLSFYIELSKEVAKLKESNSILNTDLTNCYAQVNKCYDEYPIVGYNGITAEMKQTIQEVIVYSFSHYSTGESRAKYVSDRMSQIYSKNKWGCVLGKSSSYWGYYVWYVNDLYFIYTYKSITWVVFVGYY